MVKIPVRFTADQSDKSQQSILSVDIRQCALILVDCDGDSGPECGAVVSGAIATAVTACREAGVLCVYVYNEMRPNGLFDELHFERRGRPIPTQVVNEPSWPECIKPRNTDLIVAKCHQSAFVGTDLAELLQQQNVKTLFTVGFSFKSCLFYTCVSAFQHGFRVVLLRDGTDPPGTNEFPDTIDRSLPERGWVRRVLTRLVEDHCGYTSTTESLATVMRHATEVEVGHSQHN